MYFECVLLLLCISILYFWRRRKQIQEPIKKANYSTDNIRRLLGVKEEVKIEENNQPFAAAFKKWNQKPTEIQRQGYTYIKDKRGLDLLVQQILLDFKQQKGVTQNVIGIDTENESVFSFNGYLCLIQVSTISHDYVIDLLAINDNKYVSETFGKHILENEEIVKVIHGGSNDIIWILRDFKVRMSNVFDTQDIYQQLGGKKLGLNNLWEIFCDYKMETKAKKKFQKSSWSKRPLPENMISYAATDSRYLIFLRYTLLLIALEGPSVSQQKAYPFLKGDLRFKQLSKLYSKMQRLSLSEKDHFQNLENSLKKFIKIGDENVKLESIVKCKMMFDYRNKYCKDHDLNPDCIIKTNIMYLFAEGNSSAEEELIKTGTDSSEVEQSISPHKDQIINEIRKIASEPDTNLDLKDKECLRVYRLLTTKTYKDKIAQEKEDNRKAAKKIKRDHIMEKYTVQKPIYENSMILAPDGEVLCKCDKKKINWYLDRNLAVKINDDPLTIKLTFEPSGRGVTAFDGEKFDDEFYVEYRINQCVVCGKEENYLRFQIIPSEYRMYFPEKYKAHRSHDVLLLCFDCNEIAIKKQSDLKTSLSKEYNVPRKLLHEDAQNKENVKLFQRNVCSVNFIPLLGNRPFPVESEIFGTNAKALLRGKLKIPDDRLMQMYNDFIKECKVVLSDRILRSEDHSTLKQELQEAEENPSEINYNFVERSLKLKSKKTSTTAQKRQNIHGKVLIEKFGGEERLPEFIKIWRQLFLDEMKPKFLPKNWSVDHCIIRKFGNNSKFYYEEDTKDYK